MPSRPAARHESGSDAGSNTTMPIDHTQPSPAGHPTRSMLRRQTRRNWRRNRTQNPSYQSRHSVPEIGTTSNLRIAIAILELAEQNQDQNDNKHETKPAAAVVAGPVE